MLCVSPSNDKGIIKTLLRVHTCCMLAGGLFEDRHDAFRGQSEKAPRSTYEVSLRNQIKCHRGAARH